LPDIYNHSGLGYEPLDHQGNFQCQECHVTNADVISWQYPAYQPDCAGCHAGDYKRDKHDGPGGSQESVSQNRNCAGACHDGSGEHRISGNKW
jgi:hypothetical protein